MERSEVTINVKADDFIAFVVVLVMLLFGACMFARRALDHHEEHEWLRWIATCAESKPRVAGTLDRKQCVADAITSGAYKEIE